MNNFAPREVWVDKHSDSEKPHLMLNLKFTNPDCSPSIYYVCSQVSFFTPRYYVLNQKLLSVALILLCRGLNNDEINEHGMVFQL